MLQRITSWKSLQLPQSSFSKLSKSAPFDLKKRVFKERQKEIYLKKKKGYREDRKK